MTHPSTHSLHMLTSEIFNQRCGHVGGLDSPLKTKAPPSSKWLEPYRITITNGNLPELVVGCDDQGTPGEQLSWKFRMNFWDTTSYNCRFYWFANNTNDIRYQVEVPVFNKDIIRLCGSDLFHMNRCYWYVTQTGFYYSNSNDPFPSDNWKIMKLWTNT
uniref:S-protein homolog n=1 Tax=Lactuca sativa TaxID=4236 RepID=A0A9R1XKL3_LACSA|nr:hypothetical protein LSAT_V11C300152740 [Lactuca sativa]